MISTAFSNYRREIECKNSSTSVVYLRKTDALLQTCLIHARQSVYSSTPGIVGRALGEGMRYNLNCWIWMTEKLRNSRKVHGPFFYYSQVWGWVSVVHLRGHWFIAPLTGKIIHAPQEIIRKQHGFALFMETLDKKCPLYEILNTPLNTPVHHCCLLHWELHAFDLSTILFSLNYVEKIRIA